MGVFDKYTSVLEDLDPIKFTGVVERVQGLLIESTGPSAQVGELCQILVPKGRGHGLGGGRGPAGQDRPAHALRRDGRHRDRQHRHRHGRDAAGPGFRRSCSAGPSIPWASPSTSKGDIGSEVWYPAFSSPPDVLKRKRIREILSTGVRSIDSLLTVGKGQRMGIFAGSGIGKSTLLGMIARNTSADVNVIALIGERGREVREFIENDLGPEGLARSVIVVSSSNKPPLARIRGAYVATAIAEYFRDQGKDVMLLFDSVTRFARAQREIGLAIGEPPANRGFTPSVFSLLPKLLERSGTSENGQHHRLLHDPRRGRRHRRPGLRQRPRHPGRPHRAHAEAGQQEPLPGGRRAADRSPAWPSR